MDDNLILGPININKLRPGEELVLEKTIEDLDEALEVFKINYEHFSLASGVWYDDEGRGINFNMKISTTPPYIITISIIKDI